MRMLETGRKLLGILRRAVCPRQVRMLMSEIESRRLCAGLGIDPRSVDRLQEVSRALSRLHSAVRLADHEEAIAALVQCGDGLLDVEPAYFNLLGVIAEMRRQWHAANWLYGQALFVDKSYRPAQCNLRRLFELYTFGRTRECVTLGDDMEDVLFARLPETEMDLCR
jgi:hypothetical protein